MDKLMSAANAPLGDEDKILRFIQDVYNHQGKENAEVIQNLFMSGYCYYFARMLSEAFPGGEIVWLAPYGHIAYMYNGTPYDITGKCYSEAIYFIPIRYLGRGLFDFKHIPGVRSGFDIEQIVKAIKDYCRSTGVEYKPIVEDILEDQLYH